MRNKSNHLFSAQASLETLKSSIRLLAWGMAGVVLFYLASGITMVGPSEAGIVLRFGKALPDVYPPGLLLAFPAPIDEVIKVPVKSVQEASMDLWSPADESNSMISLNPVSDFYTLTGDANIIRARFVVRYQISNAHDYALNARDWTALRDGIFYEAATTVLAGMNVEDSMTVRKDYIGQEALRLAQAKLDALQMGIQVTAFETKEVKPPAAVLPSFQAVISAKVQAKTEIEQANTYAATTIPAAQAIAYRMRQDADSYAKQLVARAAGEASSFTALLAQYKDNPKIVKARLYGETMAEILPKVKIATYAPGGTRLFLDPIRANSHPGSIPVAPPTP